MMKNPMTRRHWRLPLPAYRNLALRALSLATATAALGCGGSGEEVRDYPLRTTEYTEDGLRLVYSDVDQNGVQDTLKTFRVETDEDGNVELFLVRTDIDLTGDGVFNLARVYDDEGDLVLEEIDSNLDGTMDRTVYWQAGDIMRAEEDEDQDGVIDVTRYYREGFLNRTERDTNSDGEVDTWSYYDSGGIVRVGVDSNRDGAADQWTRRRDPEEE
jgi:hypothetical protein